MRSWPCLGIDWLNENDVEDLNVGSDLDLADYRGTARSIESQSYALLL